LRVFIVPRRVPVLPTPRNSSWHLTAAPLGSRTVQVICSRLLQPTGRSRRRSLSLVVRRLHDHDIKSAKIRKVVQVRRFSRERLPDCADWLRRFGGPVEDIRRQTSRLAWRCLRSVPPRHDNICRDLFGRCYFESLQVKGAGSMSISPNQITAANAGWRTQFRFRGSRHRPGVAEFHRSPNSAWRSS
jgi:hypothetical protein